MSDEAIIKELHSASYESTPYLDNMSSNVAREAPPDKGRVMISGSIPEGICKKSQAPDKSPVKKSLAPEAVNILTPTTNAHKVGRSLQALIAPDFAPSKNEEK